MIEKYLSQEWLAETGKLYPFSLKSGRIQKIPSSIFEPVMLSKDIIRYLIG